MLTIQGIDHVVLRIRDSAKMLHFYCDLLGCKVERQVESIGLFQLRAGQSMIDLMVVDDLPTGEYSRNMDHLCLRIEPFDSEQINAELHRHGIDSGKISTRYGAQGSGPSIYINDPEGNQIELKGPATR